jgi:hypothetical protein
MRHHLAWFVLVVAILGVLWQSQGAAPRLPPLASELLLVSLGLLLGLRVATDSATRFVGDLLRLNLYLGEQNRDLAELNNRLLTDLRLAREPKEIRPPRNEPPIPHRGAHSPGD